MLLQYCTNTKQLSKPHRVVVDYDATLNPATTIMFCKIHEQHFRTLIFQNDGTVIKTNQTPNALIKQLIAPHSDLGGIIIDGIIYHLYDVHHSGTRQLPIMGKDFLIFPAIGTSRHQGCWVFLNKYPIRKEDKSHFTIDVPEHNFELHLKANEKAFQSNKKLAYRCYGVAQAILPYHFTVKLPAHYETTLSNAELSKILRAIGTFRIIKILKEVFGMSLREIKRVIK
ncbi:hypothetical protein [Ligilactobacillus araffinosus]|uniref:hypothetical protein n=1 Tax=Ligilactobacillus araffinosus TaxID=147809 RepID=UPI00070C670E|nr:hypothetical protein [Ligilactobacillus araffinosus]